jgi:hypothetical protein
MSFQLNAVETLARELHEAGRAAVESGKTVAAEKFGDQSRRFLSWHEITEPAREGRRIQARYLLGRFVIMPRYETPDTPDLWGIFTVDNVGRWFWWVRSDVGPVAPLFIHQAEAEAAAEKYRIEDGAENLQALPVQLLPAVSS